MPLVNDVEVLRSREFTENVRYNAAECRIECVVVDVFMRSCGIRGKGPIEMDE
jgi:hypothetical protein